MKKIKELARKFKNAKAVEDLAYEAAFEEENLNDFFKLADEWEQCNYITNGIREELAKEITKISFGQIDYKTAWAMTFKPELYNLIARLV